MSMSIRRPSIRACTRAECPHRWLLHCRGSEAMQIDLPVVWAAIIGLGVFLYVVLDGFDLGIGLLFPFIESKGDRQLMLNTVAPVWDGNETFLVFGGAGLYCAFPVVYAAVLPANYLPLILMVVGLIFRGAAF